MGSFPQSQVSLSPGSARGIRFGNADTSSEPAFLLECASQDGARIAGATQPAPLPSPTPQETPAKVPRPPQQETQGALVPIEGGDIEVLRYPPVVKVGWRAYLVPGNYGGNLDCDHATCTQLAKCRGGTENVSRCVDAQDRDLAHCMNSNPRSLSKLIRAHGLLPRWLSTPLYNIQIVPAILCENSVHRSRSEGRPVVSEQMNLCTWTLAKVAEYPTLQHSDSTCDPLR